MPNHNTIGIEVNHIEGINIDNTEQLSMQNILQKNTRFNQFRFIPRFEIKGKNLIKGMRMEGFKKLDKFFYRIQNVVNQGADEIIIDDIVASLYLKIDINFLKEISNFINIPITYSGKM